MGRNKLTVGGQWSKKSKKYVCHQKGSQTATLGAKISPVPEIVTFDRCQNAH